jgi:signal recognition particle subunit SRP54
MRSLTPAQHVVRIVRDEMLALFGAAEGGLPPASRTPRVVLMLGLQGSGKTTTSAKLARWLTSQGRHPVLVSTDVRRPAAIEQLSVLGKQVGVRVHEPADAADGWIRPRAGGALAATRNWARHAHRRHRRAVAHRRRADDGLDAIKSAMADGPVV